MDRSQKEVLPLALEFELAAIIREVKDFPRPGINFQDITPLLGHPWLFARTITAMAAPFWGLGITKVIGLEARGFILGAPLALALNAGFVPARKPGKLPHRIVAERYKKEYGLDGLELHADAILTGERVLVCDDVLATGGTAEAAAKLTAQLGGEIVGYSFLMALAALEGAKRLGDCRIHSLLTY